jgi:outer membrane lipase/esterase
MKMMSRFEPWTVLQRVFGAWAVAALLAACGSSQVETFTPSRLIVFGDESSAFEAGVSQNRRKYAVNGFASDGVTHDCRALPIWTQIVAEGYGFGFDECPVGTGVQKAVSRAAAGAKVADLATQINNQLAAGGIGASDLVTVLLGTNDVKDLYAQLGTLDRAALLQEARSRGVTLGQRVNEIIGRGARVVVSTLPQLGRAPYGATRDASLLNDLTYQLNDGLRVTMINDGHKVALVFADELVQIASSTPSSLGLVNASAAACKATAALPTCTTSTLDGAASASTWLWADDTWLAHGGHRELGSRALTRVRASAF